MDLLDNLDDVERQITDQGAHQQDVDDWELPEDYDGDDNSDEDGDGDGDDHEHEIRHGHDYEEAQHHDQDHNDLDADRETDYDLRSSPPPFQIDLEVQAFNNLFKALEEAHKRRQELHHEQTRASDWGLDE